MRPLALRLMLGMAVIAATVVPLQSQTQTAPKSAFEVASIKLQLPPIARANFQLEHGRFVAEGFPLKYLLVRAFGVPASYILGAPDWVDSERYKIEAKVEGTIPPDELPRMLRTLLVDRFQLKAHQETRELPVYELLVDRGGPKLKVSEDQTPADPPPVTGERLSTNATTPRGAFGFGSGVVNSRAVQLSRLTDFLRSRLGQPVIDKTGLTGLFDIELRWAPGSEGAPSTFQANPDAPFPQVGVSGPSLFTALQEQLGLRLRSAKAPLDLMLIDSVQRPSEN